MAYENQFKKVAVLGAAGKMGSGILLLAAIEMAKIKFQQDDPENDFTLYAMDISDEGLKGVMKYIEKQVRKNDLRFRTSVCGQNRELLSLSKNRGRCGAVSVTSFPLSRSRIR